MPRGDRSESVPVRAPTEDVSCRCPDFRMPTRSLSGRGTCRPAAFSPDGPPFAVSASDQSSPASFPKATSIPATSARCGFGGAPDTPVPPVRTDIARSSVFLIPPGALSPRTSDGSPVSAVPAGTRSTASRLRGSDKGPVRSLQHLRSAQQFIETGQRNLGYVDAGGGHRQVAGQEQ